MSRRPQLRNGRRHPGAAASAGGPPTTSALAPSTGERWYATRAGNVLTGTGFTAASTVTFGSTSGIVPTAWTPTTLTFTIPDAELDYPVAASVNATTPGTGTSNAQTYTITQPASMMFNVRGDLGRTMNGGNLQGWADQSLSGDANRNLSQLTVARQPVYNASSATFNNQSTISFTASQSQYIQSGTWASNGAAAMTVYYVGKCSVANTYDALLDCPAGNRFYLYNNNNIMNFQGSGVGFTTTATNTNVSPYVLAAVVNGASSALYKSSSSTTVATGTCGAASISSVAVSTNSVASIFSDSEIAEVIYIGRAESATQRAQVYAYIARRYGQAVA